MFEYTKVNDLRLARQNRNLLDERKIDNMLERLEGEKRKVVKAILKEKDGMIGQGEKIHASTKRRALKS